VIRPAACAALLFVLAGCTTGSTSSAATDGASSVRPPSTLPSLPVSTVPAATSPASATSAVTSTAAPGTSSPPPSHTTTLSEAQLNTCTKVAVETVRGGAIAGTQIAGVIVVNKGTKPCDVHGFPTVVLLRNGRPMRAAARPDGPAASVRLKAGDYAQAQLTVESTCNSAESDAVRITLPGRTTTTDEPIKLRGCAATITALAPPD